MFLKRKRRVRLHLAPGLGPETVEGVQAGRRPVCGFHVLELPKVIVREGETHSLPHPIEVPAGHVVLREVLSR